ncbi:MAG: hypothetical protein KTR31_09185 [Myxococcales bacterium]|nr:hypothetical protein [Myxococcales bacterium]
MSRTVAVAVGSALLGAASMWTMLHPASAQEVVSSPPTVVCTQLQQLPGQVDEAFVQRFMASQIAAGRKRFESVTGVSTVLCAW